MTTLDLVIMSCELVICNLSLLGKTESNKSVASTQMAELGTSVRIVESGDSTKFGWKLEDEEVELDGFMEEDVKIRSWATVQCWVKVEAAQGSIIKQHFLDFHINFFSEIINSLNKIKQWYIETLIKSKK